VPHGVCIILKFLSLENVYLNIFSPIGGPCKMISPFFEELSGTYTSLKFVKVDVDELEDVSSEAGVR
jgi:thioredoxin 1